MTYLILPICARFYKLEKSQGIADKSVDLKTRSNRREGAAQRRSFNCSVAQRAISDRLLYTVFVYSLSVSRVAGKSRPALAARPPLQATRILDQVRERIRTCHYSPHTERAYVQWVRDFIRWSGVRHPATMGAPEVEAFLSHLANVRRISPATHKQALSALLFLYREVLGVDLPWA